MQLPPIQYNPTAQLHGQDHSVSILQIRIILKKLFDEENMKKAAAGYFSFTTNKSTFYLLAHQTRSRRLQNIENLESVNQENKDQSEAKKKKIQDLLKWTWFNRIH